MSSRHHIDDFMRGRIIGKIEEGRKITDVSRDFDITHSVVSRLWKSFKTTGMCSRRHGGGRVRSTTPAEDSYIVLSAKSNRRTTAQQVVNQFLAASGKQISRKTVARRLRGGGLYARRPVVCVLLTRQHRTAHLQWCHEHHNWTEQDWACVLFSDERRFSLSSDCRRQLIWRESGTAYRPENIQEKDRYPTCSIMVWAGIMINGRTRLHVVANGTMTGQRYIDKVLLPHVRLFRGALGDKFVFMDDNVTCHRTLAVQDCLDSEGIQRLVWPARSPDLNPIENVWDALGRQVAGRNYPPTNKNTLIRALTEEWDKLPQQLLDNVVQTVYSALVANLDAENLSYVSDIVLSPPNSDKYHTLSQRLITQFSDSETQKIKKLLTDLQLGDEKPSHLLRKMKELSNGQLQDDFLQSLWLQRMPPHIQTVLSASSEPLDKLAITADKVSEVVGASFTICAASTVPPPSQSSSCSVQPTMDSLARQIQELSLQVAELTRERNSSRHQRYSSDRRRSHSRSRSVNRGSGICYYHRRYKEQARKCVSPCAFVQKNE
ncbi:transposable element Tcb1 transposase [Trichonephila clavipes]|nr:transposable element Tcb1 transposase [Trichonephila clavipes]